MMSDRKEPPQRPQPKTPQGPNGNPAGRMGTPDFKIGGKPIRGV